MKKLIFIMLAVIFSVAVKAQDKVYNREEVDVVAEPIEGIKTFYQNVVKEIKIPNTDVLPSQKINFLVYFVVETDGSFSDFKIEGESAGHAENVIATLKQMPKWKPALQNNQAVRSQMIFPVTLLDKRAKS